MAKNFVEATDEMLAYRQMLIDRIPGIQPMLDERLARASEEVQEILQPLIDWAEGKISWEEYEAITKARDAEEQERRQEYYEDLEVDGEIEVECAHCGTTHAWILELQEDKWPPLFFECEDITGVDCQEEDDE